MKPCLVDIWTVPLEAPRPIILSADEQTRANRFRLERDRLHWLHARSAMRATLALYVSRAPEDLVFVYGEHGKPSLSGDAGIEFNVSHSRGWAMIAVTRGVAVGIDVEQIRKSVDMARLLERIGETEVTGSTAELFRVWTRREARTKATGSPLMEIPLARVCAVDVQAPTGFAASVALDGFEPAARYQGF